MRLVILLLACGISATLQQDLMWSSPYSWLHHYLAGDEPHHPPQPVRTVHRPAVSVNPRNRISHKDAADLLKMIMSDKEESKDDGEKPSQMIEARIKNQEVQDRSFGGLKLLGLNAIANYYLNSLSFSTTSTTFSTVTSTLTIGTIVTCYTRTLFLSTTPCRRRKRKLLPGLLVGDDNSDSSPISPSKTESIEASLELEALKNREGNVDTSKFLIQSSMKEEGEAREIDGSAPAILSSQVRQKRFFGYPDLDDLPEETIYISTSVLTTYSFYTSSVTSTIIRLAAQSVLSCLPACFTLC